MTFYNQNIRGINTKLHIITRNVAQVDYHEMVLYETWLHNNIGDSELGLLPTYNISL